MSTIEQATSVLFVAVLTSGFWSDAVESEPGFSKQGLVGSIRPLSTKQHIATIHTFPIHPMPTNDQIAEQNAQAQTGQIAFRVQDLCRSYFLKGETVHALRGVSFDVMAGEYIAIMGPSGSGKSTLLNLLGCLDRPTSGKYLLAGDDVAKIDDYRLSRIRGRRIGFVFQSYNLLQQLNVLENIKVPLQYQGLIHRDALKICKRLAERVGLGDRLYHRPTELSGGQQQRVAIARSLVNDPYFVLADEATGNLDSKTTEEVLDLFESLNSDGKTIIMITHEDEVAARAKRVIRLRDGLVESDVLNET